MTNIDRRSGQVSYELPSHPDYPLGVANIVRSHEGMDGLGDARLHIMESTDPANLLSIERQEEIIIEESHFNSIAEQRAIDGYYHRYPRMAYDEGLAIADPSKRGWGDTDPHFGSMTLFKQYINREAFGAWLSKLPSAEALRYLSGPFADLTIKHKESSIEHPIDDLVREWFQGCTDARAIRSRAAVMSFILGEIKNQSGCSIYTPKWLSVACGTALPVYQAAKQRNGTFYPDFNMVDIDEQALDMAISLFYQFELKGTIKKHPKNAILDEHALDEFTAEIVDAVGIFEYIGQPLIDRYKMPKNFAEIFLKRLYDATDRYLIFGQMREDRPVKYFTEAVIGWPWIDRRNPSEVIKMAESVGIPSRAIDVYLTPEGVYGVYLIDKSKV